MPKTVSHIHEYHGFRVGDRVITHQADGRHYRTIKAMQLIEWDPDKAAAVGLPPEEVRVEFVYGRPAMLPHDALIKRVAA